MKKHDMSVVNRGLNPDQIGEIFSPIIAEVLKLSTEEIQCWIGKKKKLAAEIRQVLKQSKNVILEEVREWINLYQECFGIALNLNKIALPDEQENTWLVIADEQVTNNQVYDVWGRLFPRYRYTYDLNKVYDLHAKGTIARRFKAVVEADEEHLNRSANDIENTGLTPKAITLRERMLLEIWNFRKTGKHLDINNWTLCAGSRDPDGSVPGVDLHGDRVSVSWRSPDARDGRLRSRVAVS